MAVLRWWVVASCSADILTQSPSWFLVVQLGLQIVCRLPDMLSVRLVQQHSRGLPETVRHNHASNNGMDLTLAAQYAELAQISAQMASLREDLASAARPGNAAAAAAAPPAAPADQVSRFIKHSLDCRGALLANPRPAP